MANNIIAFQFCCNSVRVIIKDNNPWFVGKDITDILQINNNRDALSRLKDYEKGVATIDTLGGNQEMTIISESGLYRLILTSRKPQAGPFQDWVCQDVLPSIRKTGNYSVKAEFKVPQTYGEALLEAAMLAIENEKLKKQIETEAPLVAYANAVQYSEDAIEISEFAKMLGTGQARLLRAMRECDIIMRRSTLPYQRWCEAGYFEVSQEINSKGKLIPFALITGKGQLWLHNRLRDHWGREKAIINAIARSCEVFA